MATTAKSATKPAVLPKVTGYNNTRSYLGTRYKQGGRTVYALELSPLELRAIVDKPDPEVHTPGNRAIRRQHAADFARYFRENPEWVSPSLILRTSQPFDFAPLEGSDSEAPGAAFGVVSFPISATHAVHILDGQHRILGFYIADESIGAELDKLRNLRTNTKRIDPSSAALSELNARINELEKQAKRLETERVSVQIIVEPDTAAYRQAFFDIADNALGITASVRARFDTRKVVNRALEAVVEHPLLVNRVDDESDRLRSENQNLMGAKHVAEIIRTTTVGLAGRVSRIQDNTLNEQDVIKSASDFLDLIVKAFPQFEAIILGQLMPRDLRRNSLLGSILFVRVLAGVYYDLETEHAWTDKMILDFFQKLSPHLGAPVYPGSIWLEHVDPSIFDNGGRGPHGRHQDLKLLKDTLVDWAIDKPAFLDKEPAPRPVVVETEPTEEEADAILRPEIAKARKTA